MKSLRLPRHALAVGVASAMLAGCGALPFDSAQGRLAQGDMSPIGAGTKFAARSLESRSYQVIYNFQASNDAELPYWEDAPLLYSGGLLYGAAAGGNTGEGCGVSCGTAFEVSPSGDESLLYTFKGQPDSGNPFGALISFQGAIYGVAASGGSSGNGAIFALDSSGNERVVYSFKGGSDGAFPAGPLTTFNGMLYGTTVNGGTDSFGTVFSLKPSGKERVLHSFKHGADGEHPYGGVTVLDGKLYGTTDSGGTYGFGTVFGVSLSGKERVIYSFAYGTDGAAPSGQLTVAGGKLYGTTTDGGGDGYLGTVFEVAPSGVERVLHRFLQSIVDGESPEGTLLHHNGKFYGTTILGGRHGLGTVFVVTTSGKEHIVHNFATVPDGRYPTGGLTAINDILYGTTNEGGTGACAYGDGCGTVFALHP